MVVQMIGYGVTPFLKNYFKKNKNCGGWTGFFFSSASLSKVFIG